MWKTIEICPDYEINEKGIIRIKKDSPYYHEPLEIIEDEIGYKCVRMHFVNKIKIAVPIHKLVAQAFIENNEGLLFVGHKDYNIKNNLATNLIWIDSYTYKQYAQEYRKIKLLPQENEAQQNNNINQDKVEDITNNTQLQDDSFPIVPKVPSIN